MTIHSLIHSSSAYIPILFRHFLLLSFCFFIRSKQAALQAAGAAVKGNAMEQDREIAVKNEPRAEKNVKMEIPKVAGQGNSESESKGKGKEATAGAEGKEDEQETEEMKVDSGEANSSNISSSSAENPPSKKRPHSTM
jgi:hypothetical protein